MLIGFAELLERFGLHVSGVVHIGAHECEELAQYHSKGVTKTVWFEALPELVDRCRCMFPGVNIHRAVLSDVDGKETDFIVTNNYQSSSLLELKDHLIIHPTVREVRRDRVVTTTFETCIEERGIDISGTNFLNLDVQGMELPVIKGMGEYLIQFNYIYTEVNEKELYAGCTRLPELDEYLQERGFGRVATAMTEYGWGDALYVRVAQGFYSTSRLA